MSKLAYKSRILSVYEDSVKNNGKNIKMIRVAENDAVVIIPVKPDGKIVLERQYRHVINRWIYELPAGHVDGGESYKAAATRELREETGYSATLMKKLFVGYPAPGTYTQKQIFFLASGLVRGKTNFDDDEQIGVCELGLETIEEMIRKNVIMDNKTIAGILYYSNNIISKKRKS